MRSVKVLVAVVVVALLGATAAFAATAFEDVPQGAFYDEPTAWAVEQGLTVGCNRAAGQDVSDTFCPLANVTRGENITFTYRHQTLVIDPLLDDIRNDVSANRDAAAAAQAAADGAVTDAAAAQGTADGAVTDAAAAQATADTAASDAASAQSTADGAQAAVDAVADEVAAERQRVALLQWWQTTIAVGNNPRGVAFDGTHVWVANLIDGSVSKIDAVTGGVVATVTVGAFPYGVAFDGTHIWVTNNGDGTVSKIPAG